VHKRVGACICATFALFETRRAKKVGEAFFG
jgi:hypothetical protein